MNEAASASDAYLVRKAQAGDSQAFGVLVGRYMRAAYAVSLSVTGRHDDAEDAAQDAFMSAYRNFHRFRGESSVSTWLYRIAVNAALMRLRKDRNKKLLTQTGYDEMQLESPTDDPEKLALNSELRDRLEEGLDLLAPNLKAAVVMRDVQGLSNEEAAQTLKISVSSLKARLHRGRILLRQHLQGYLAQQR